MYEMLHVAAIIQLFLKNSKTPSYFYNEEHPFIDRQVHLVLHVSCFCTAFLK